MLVASCWGKEDADVGSFLSDQRKPTSKFSVL